VTTWLNTPIQMQFRVVDGLTVRFAQSEDRNDHALLLSPWPESLLASEPMWARLAEHAHLVAIDLPGFGHSQRHDALLSPRAMGEFVIRAADAFGLEHPHVAGPDIGTAAALFAAAAYPGRLRSLVVGSGGAAVPLQLGSWLND
jgi:pimeloyl-ACP methyl ester carboxylesterase